MKCVLEGVDFTGAKLRAATMFGCNANGAIFAGISGSSFRVVEGTSLVGCDFRGADLTSALRAARRQPSRASDLSEVQRTAGRTSAKCNMQDANLRHANAKQARFVRDGSHAREPRGR